MIHVNGVYNLLAPIKGWPVKEAKTLEEAGHKIFGSPYWQIPEDIYKVIDKNETYSLLAVYREGKISWNKRYLALNMKLVDHIEPISKNEDKTD